MVELHIGEVITTPQDRDAIHIAVAPVTVAYSAEAGDHVGLNAQGYASDDAYPHIGIIDPFLKVAVRSGAKVWLFLYPNTITSLRHNWTHPEFPDGGNSAMSNKAVSEAWLRDFVAHADCPTYEEVVAAAMNHPNNDCWDDDYLHFDGRDAHGEIPPEFWTHVEIVTGRRIEKRASYFSCSC